MAVFFKCRGLAASTAILRRSSPVCQGTIILSSPAWKISENVPSHPHLEQPRFKLFRPRGFSGPLRDKWWKPRLLGQLDLFHPTYYDLTYGFSFSDFKCPTVLTVYDFIYAIYPKLIEGSEGVIRDQTEAIRKADHIICISKATENNLLERFQKSMAKPR